MPNTANNQNFRRSRKQPRQKFQRVYQPKQRQQRPQRQPRQRQSNRQRVQNNPNRTKIGKLMVGAGTALGAYLGAPGIGREFGTSISRVFGQGDYTVRENSILNGGPPSFAAINSGIRISHREYIRDVLGSVAYTNSAQSIYPTNPTLFPWLSSMASNFEEYRIKGIVFYFNTTCGNAIASTNNALGVIGMTTVYDPTDPALASKRENEDYAGCVSSVPSKSFMHAVECKPNSNVLERLYVPLPNQLISQEDLKFYSHGTLNLFTQGMQVDNVNIGELWVTYDIEFYNPKILPIGTIQQAIGRIWSNSVSPLSTSVFGTNLLTNDYGNLPFNVKDNKLSLPNGTSSGYYMGQIMTNGSTSTAFAIAATNTTSINCQIFAGLNNFTNSTYVSPEIGVAANVHTMTFMFNKTTSASCSLNFGTSGTLPGSFGSIEIWLSKIPLAAFQQSSNYSNPLQLLNSPPSLNDDLQLRKIKFDELIRKLELITNPIDESSQDEQSPEIISLKGDDIVIAKPTLKKKVSFR